MANRRPYQHVLDVLARQYGLNLAIATRPRLAAVIDQSVRDSHCDSIERYGDLLASAAGGPALAALARRLVVGETYFFRNAPQFVAIEQQILPELLKAATERATAVEPPRLRIWCAGCATGEEPSSSNIFISTSILLALFCFLSYQLLKICRNIHCVHL